ncbi:MAG: methyl-accepting chemotaxis protein [Candidatus Competibacteraceae bacterium]|nr:methyl-accepting chemotaxis protein [Candidatus Competibacteraceae bacterium]
MKLRTQLNLGFAMVLVLLIIVATVAWYSLRDALNGFTEYRRLAQSSNHIADFQDDMLEVRLAVKDFVVDGDDNAVQVYRQRFGTMGTEIKDLKEHVKHPERAKQVALIEEESQQYHQAFDQVVTLTEQRNELETRLGTLGADALNTLISLSHQAGNDQNAVVLTHIEEATVDFLEARVAVLYYFRSHQPAQFEKAWEAMVTKVNQRKKALVESTHGAYPTQLETFAKAHDAYVALLPTLRETIEKSDDLIQNTLDRIGPKVAHITEEIKTSYRTDQETLGSKVAYTNALAVNIMTGLSIAAVVLGMVLAWLIARLIQRPIGGEPTEIALITGQIAAGDLTVHFTDTGKETGIYAAMREMTRQLREMVSQVTQATDQVSAAAAEIAQGSADLSQRTEEQASALEETASSMEELTSTVKQSADNAAQANQLAGAARTQAEQGGHVVEQATTAMSAISTSSRQIADIISVIDEIAFQTNLLALNAAVEAARAGEQGRGFAVVAGEVRKLAQRSADAAKEIKSLITDSVAKVEDGGKLVEQSGKTLQEIVTAVKKVSDIVAEMAAASREQANGIEQVNTAILSMDQVTQQNAALVEETAAASQSMGEQARELQNLMSFFKLDEPAVINAHARA